MATIFRRISPRIRICSLRCYVASTKTEESFIVDKAEPVLVRSANKTPGGNYILSNLDQTACLCTKMLLRFNADERKKNKNVIDLSKDALAKVLNEFYPYTGRPAINSDGKFMIKCSGEGVPFVEAYVGDNIEVIGDITSFDPERNSLVHFVERSEDVSKMPPLTLQVTRFKCGGFVIGVGINHLMNDATSLGEFMNSWAETARGVKLTVTPFLDRTIIKARQPPQIEFPHYEFAEVEYEEFDLIPPEQMVHWSFCLHPEKLNRLKSIVCSDPSMKKPPTNFELVCALMWRCRTMALKVNPDEKVKLSITINLRTKVNGFIPKGYFGNGFLASCCQCNAGELVEKPLSFAVRLVQEAIASVTETYAQSYIDCFEVKRQAFALKNTFYMTKTARMPIYNADFGWGDPIQVGHSSFLYREGYYYGQGMGSENVVLSTVLPVFVVENFQERIQSELML